MAFQSPLIHYERLLHQIQFILGIVDRQAEEKLIMEYPFSLFQFSKKLPSLAFAFLFRLLQDVRRVADIAPEMNIVSHAPGINPRG